MTRTIFLFAITASLFASPACAALLTQFTFDNSLNASNTLTGTTVSSLTKSVGMTTGNFFNTAGTFNEGTHSIGFTFADLPNQATSLTSPPEIRILQYTDIANILPMGTDFLETTISAETGNTIDFEGITIDVKRGLNNGNSAARVYFSLYYDKLADVDGFKHLGSYLTVATDSTLDWQNDVLFDFNALADLNSIGTEGVIFRLSVFDSSGSSTTISGLYLDDLKFNGTVSAVPEPMALTQLAVGGLIVGLFAMRRIARK